jgi:hypothetical protein
VVLSGFFHHKFFLAGHHNIAEILLKVALNTKNSRARTHAVLVIGLYELLGNPTT